MVQDGVEYTYTSGVSRFKNSLGAAGIGLLLFLGSFAMLGYNEQNSVDEIRTIAECTKNTVEASCGPHYNVNYNSKLVHIQDCGIQNMPTWNDPMFAVSAQSLYLRRKVWMYQWRETSDKRCTKDSSGGGGEHCITEYHYNTEWSNQPIPEGHGPNAHRYVNPPWPAQFQSSLQAPGGIVAGMYYLPKKLVDELVQVASQSVDVALPSSGSLCRPGKNCGIWKVSNGVAVNYGTYDPQVGALKIAWTKSATTQVSAIGVQQPYRGSTWIGAQAQLQPYTSKKNHGHQCFEVAAGSETAKQLWDKKSSANSVLTWILRVGGFVIMWLGLVLVLSPVEVLVDCIPCIGPCIGDLAAAGICASAFVISMCLSFLTIAIAWVFVRPLIGGPLFGGAALFLGLWLYQAYHGKKRRKCGDPEHGFEYSTAPNHPAGYAPHCPGYGPGCPDVPPQQAGYYAPPGAQTMYGPPGYQPVHPTYMGGQPVYPPVAGQPVYPPVAGQPVYQGPGLGQPVYPVGGQPMCAPVNPLPPEAYCGEP
mmetsp:Transcript_9994/g.11630  ORF Transcript_9994/g.11630 Transcript_9994/m.11630 type:complete len:532 (-) Transcript_9994:169-1764(-)|eukprot:CAMPEP_0197863190 /NCGR_PEP_ID=MMETSP1438-20131217/40484_1 /TAXON_ID=1461541 /ORGANISM="Pterosperma sp., Strain CCMP1384" /LENGTH=531 /DNA_ID=CAMNT_0043481003 /DNA_START=77 /DNA_END=1672 /DNA_ORIENTATION=-